jgi:hypothetical protein
MHRSEPRRWVFPLTTSVSVHVAAIVLFWQIAQHVPVKLSPPAGLSEIVVAEPRALVMDIDVGLPCPTPVPLIPTIAPPPIAPTVAPAPEGTAVAPAPEAPSSAAAAPGHEESESGGTGGAGGATTVFFQVPAQARSVVYVIDRSGSMGIAGRLALARRELLASMQRLPADTRFQIIPYNRHAEPLRIAGHSGLLPANGRNKEVAARLIDALVPEGATEHVAALKAALRLEPEVIYFLTDADDLRPDEVRALTRLNHGRTTIHAIELNSTNRDRDDMPLHVLARENRGWYRAVDVK